MMAPAISPWWKRLIASLIWRGLFARHSQELVKASMVFHR